MHTIVHFITPYSFSCSLQHSSLHIALSLVTHDAYDKDGLLQAALEINIFFQLSLKNHTNPQREEITDRQEQEWQLLIVPSSVKERLASSAVV